VICLGRRIGPLAERAEILSREIVEAIGTHKPSVHPQTDKTALILIPCSGETWDQIRINAVMDAIRRKTRANGFGTYTPPKLTVSRLGMHDGELEAHEQDLRVYQVELPSVTPGFKGVGLRGSVESLGL
jgi:hypothetical protein